MNVDEQYPIVSEDDAVKDKDWAAGARVHVDFEELVMSPTERASVRTIKYPPALLKIFDEILVNATDHIVRTENESGVMRATNVNVVVSPTGEITITNNGRGIRIERHNAMSQREKTDIYLPTFFFNYMHQSTNHNKSADNIIGGTNGMGAKIVLIMSKYARLVTCDGGRIFTQEWRDGRKNMLPHKIAPYSGAPYTSVTFMPDYDGLFGYSSGITQLVMDLYYTRVAFAAFYIKMISPRSTISFNGVAINTTPEILLSELYPDSHPVRITLKPNGAPVHMRYAWDIFAVGSDKKPFHTSAVNGIVVRSGTHMKFIKANITNILRDAVKAKLSDKTIKINAEMFKFSFVAVTPIPNPRWTGQRKDQLDYNTSDFAPYVFTPLNLRGLIDDIVAKVLDAVLSRKTKKTHREPQKYKSANIAGSSRSREATLFCVEGDSAFAQVEIGISKNPKLTFEKCGLYSLGGVIVNARKEIVVHDRAKRIFNKSEKWRSNVRINGLIDVLGLNFEYKYEPGSAAYEREMKTLRYGRLIAAVDQDHDGKGNILPLLMSMFAYVWPGLIAGGYIGWIMSPICQVYPKNGGKVHAFYHLSDFDKWATNPPFAYDVKYCKGLAGNTEEEGIHVFKHYRENIFLFTLDPDAEMVYDIYYGEDANKRKVQLAKIGLLPTPELLARRKASRTIPSSEHLLLEADAFQKDNLERKLENSIDGLTKGRRKVLDGCIDKFRAKPNQRVKVVDLAAKVMSSKQYEHGESSLHKTIIHMAGTYVGGRQLPYLLPDGIFGTRTRGPSAAGAPRYIFALFNSRLVNTIFPPEDYPLLKFTINEGQRGEPEYFVPIIPTVILESIELPAHGWKLKKWARDAISVIDYVKLFITDKPALMHASISPYTHDWHGEFRASCGKIWAVGKYRIVGDTVVVTELPMCVWTEDWVASIRAKLEEEVKTTSGGTTFCDIDDPYIFSIDHRGNNGNIINTVITMKPGAIAALLENSIYPFDGIEMYLNLRKSQTHNLNLMTEHKTVREFRSYESVVAAWYPHRRALYEHRLRRRRQLLLLRLELETQKLRYIEESKNLARESIAAMTQYVLDNNYPKLSPGLLTGIHIMSDDELDRKFHDGDFNYLFKLNDYKKSAEGVAKIKESIADITRKLSARVNEIFPGANEWLAELDALRAIIELGRKTKWKYEDAKKYTFE